MGVPLPLVRRESGLGAAGCGKWSSPQRYSTSRLPKVLVWVMARPERITQCRWLVE